MIWEAVAAIGEIVGASIGRRKALSQSRATYNAVNRKSFIGH
jgi:hypothetical protein